MKRKVKTIEKNEEYLRKISQPVDFQDKLYLKDIEALEEFCQNTKCFALAAIQLGIPKRIIYLKNTLLKTPDDDIKHNERKILINPEIIYKKGHTKYWESCLSCLDNMGLVTRPYSVKVKYYDPDGQEHIKIFKDFETTVFIHEYDHLNGILHIDVAERIINMPHNERKKFRKTHPYKIISKNDIFK